MRYVYFMEAHTASNLIAVKIGVASNPHKRLKNLQCGSPTKIRLIAYVEGDERLESRLHQTFDPIGLRGEWFARLHKLDYFLNYLENYAEENERRGLVTFEQFEIAISDNVAGPSWMPCDSATEEEHEESANAGIWAEYA